MKRNILLEPKWKERTHNTHMKHLSTYSHGKYKVAFLGDSMMERWLTTGSQYWEKFSNHANLGVGGDGVEHLLYRLTENETCSGILDVMEVDKIILMIGTNNIDKKPIDDIFAAVVNIINIIFKKQPNVQLIIYGLTDRTDVSNEKISALNTKLETYIKNQNNNKLMYRYFGNKVNHDNKFFDDNVHLSRLGYKEWFDDLLHLALYEKIF